MRLKHKRKLSHPLREQSEKTASGVGCVILCHWLPNICFGSHLHQKGNADEINTTAPKTRTERGRLFLCCWDWEVIWLDKKSRGTRARDKSFWLLNQEPCCPSCRVVSLQPVIVAVELPLMFKFYQFCLAVSQYPVLYHSRRPRKIPIRDGAGEDGLWLAECLASLWHQQQLQVSVSPLGSPRSPLSFPSSLRNPHAEQWMSQAPANPPFRSW